MPAAVAGTSTLMRADNNALAVNTPLGNNGWADDFSQQISWLSTQKNQVAELHLNPPDLGPLDVVLTMNDKQASIQFSSPHGVVRDAVENALPKLREIFADNGIMLGNTTVSDQTPRDRNAAGFMNQNPGSGTRRDSDDEAARAGVQAVNDIPAVAVRRHIGMVDTVA
ncbi:MAG: flagellar hook-length control protein FliK [Nitrosomonadales bacterium]|nr:flagellar hook-length control protein FliK [Nitrosomonadales bacterium]